MSWTWPRVSSLLGYACVYMRARVCGPRAAAIEVSACVHTHASRGHPHRSHSNAGPHPHSQGHSNITSDPLSQCKTQQQAWPGLAWPWEPQTRHRSGTRVAGDTATQPHKSQTHNHSRAHSSHSHRLPPQAGVTIRPQIPATSQAGRVAQGLCTEERPWARSAGFSTPGLGVGGHAWVLWAQKVHAPAWGQVPPGWPQGAGTGEEPQARPQVRPSRAQGTSPRRWLDACSPTAASAGGSRT